MKLLKFLLLLLTTSLFINIPLSAQCANENFSFGDGEVVSYNAYYNWHFIWINAGEVKFSVSEKKLNNHTAWFLSAYGRTYKSYDHFMKVRDTFEVYMDKELYRPLKYRQVTKEGSTEAYHLYDFNYDDNKIYTHIRRGPEGDAFADSIVNIQGCINDLLSMVYNARNINYDSYAVGTKIPITMIVDGRVYDLYIKYLGKEEIETRDDRTFRCLKFSPLLVPGTIFKSGEDMTVWVTDDLNRIPIIVEAKVLIGSVKAVFLDARGVRNPITSEVFDN